MRTARPIQPWQALPELNGVLWRSEAGLPIPDRLVVANDTMTADEAYRLACEGCSLLWKGDFHNARQLLLALMRRCERSATRRADVAVIDAATRFHLHRQAQGQRARVLSKVLIPLHADYTIALRRAPDIRAACTEVYGACTDQASLVSLRELQSLIGAHEWRKKGVPIAVLEDSIYPHYGVFSPLRGEYLELVAAAKLPSDRLAFDIGTGTGVLAALLAKRGVRQVIATEQDPRAIACARENLARLGWATRVEVQQTDLFPEGTAPLIVCNPPWVPARPSAPIEYAVYDPDSRMLRGFLAGLAQHLEPQGEGWLLLSDLAEHLGLRSRDELSDWITGAGLRVLERIDIKPQHSKVRDQTDPLHAARANETTSLWRLTHAAFTPSLINRLAP